MPKNRLITKSEISTYAEVLLDATQQSGTTFEVTGQLQDVCSIMRSHPGLRDNLNDDTVPPENRSNIVREVFKDCDPSLVAVMAVMAERRDMDLISRVAEDFNDLAEDALDVVFLDVTTVVELDDALRKKIKEKFAAQFGRDVMLREHIDPSILGGVILGAHGKRIDASVVTKLEDARVVLSSVKTGGES
ncbi:MAG: ATP synthase F1 subunit delta [Coriobacteriaceae bacterium]|nr:ATP synthase F1 subunit delta [Coriobacteriaceae bacterium]